MARLPLTAVPPSPAPARWRNRAPSFELVGELHDLRVGHGAALDIDGAVEPAGAVERAAHLGQVAPDLHHHGGVGIGEAALELVFGERRRQHGEHVVALRDRRPDRRPAARHAGDAGDDLGRVARGEPHMQMHVGAVEQRIAFGDHGDDAAGVEMRGDGRGRRVVERGERLAIGGVRLGDLGRDRIEQRQLLDAGLEMRGGDGARVARVPRLGEMGDDVGLVQSAMAFSVSRSGSPGPTPTPMRRPVIVPPWRAR